MKQCSSSIDVALFPLKNNWKIYLENTIRIDYIEYMMGYTISTYNDVRMKGVDFLRNLYAAIITEVMITIPVADKNAMEGVSMKV